MGQQKEEESHGGLGWTERKTRKRRKGVVGLWARSQGSQLWADGPDVGE